MVILFGFVWEPKQEIFMSKIIGLLENGVMFGIGAAVDFIMANSIYLIIIFWFKI